MLYRAVFLARLGETGRAAELLKGINLNLMDRTPSPRGTRAR